MAGIEAACLTGPIDGGAATRQQTFDERDSADESAHSPTEPAVRPRDAGNGSSPR